MRSLLIGITLLFLDLNEARAASLFEGQTCYASRGYESLEKLNQDGQAQIRMCHSEKSSCYAMTGDYFCSKFYHQNNFFPKFPKRIQWKIISFNMCFDFLLIDSKKSNEMAMIMKRY